MGVKGSLVTTDSKITMFREKNLSLATGVWFLLIIVINYGQCCGPAEIGKSYTITSTATATVQPGAKIKWQLVGNAVVLFDSELPNPNIYSEVFVGTNTQLTIKNVSKSDGTDTIRHLINGVNVYSCTLPVYKRASTPTCENSTLEGNDFTVTCTTAEVFPQARCLFILQNGDKYNRNITDDMSYITYNHNDSQSDGHEYYNTSCTLQIPVDGFQTGDWTVTVNMYPNVTGVPLDQITVGQAANALLLSIPTVNIDLDHCPKGLPGENDTNVRNGYIRQGERASCLCTRVQAGNPPGTVGWSSTEIGSFDILSQSEDEAIIQMTAMGTFTCQSVSVLNGSAHSMNYTPIYAYGASSASITFQPPGPIYLCPNQTTNTSITCQVPKDSFNPAPLFTIRKGNSSDLVAIVPGDTALKKSVHYNFTSRGQHNFTCKVENTVFSDIFIEAPSTAMEVYGKRKEQNDPYFDPYDVDEDNPFDVDVVPESSEGEIEYPLMAPLNLQRLISEPSGYDQSQNSGEGASTSQEGTRGESQEPAETTMSPSQSQIRRAFEKAPPQTSLQVTGQYVSIDDSGTWVKQGSAINVSCWTPEAYPVVTLVNVTCGKEMSLNGQLTVSGVSGDVLTCKCAVDHETRIPCEGLNLNKEVTLKTVFGPNEVNISLVDELFVEIQNQPRNLCGFEGLDLTVTCAVNQTAIRPRFTSNELRLDHPSAITTMKTSLESSGHIYRLVSKMKINAGGSLTLTCEARNPKVRNIKQTQSVTIEARKPPTTSPVVTARSTQNGDVLVLGDDVTITCSVYGGYPSVQSVVLTCGQNYSVTSNGSLTELIINEIGPSNSVINCICQATHVTGCYDLMGVLPLNIVSFNPNKENQPISLELVGVIAGAVGGTLVILAVIALIVFCVRRRKKATDEDRNKDREYNHLEDRHVYESLKLGSAADPPGNYSYQAPSAPSVDSLTPRKMKDVKAKSPSHQAPKETSDESLKLGSAADPPGNYPYHAPSAPSVDSLTPRKMKDVKAKSPSHQAPKETSVSESVSQRTGQQYKDQASVEETYLNAKLRDRPDPTYLNEGLDVNRESDLGAYCDILEV